MKRTICVLLSILSLCFLAFPVLAEQTPAIIRQIQNPIYGKYDVATYSVTAYGDSLKCTWYLLFEGKEYNISRTDGGAKPWEAYAGETYGATEEKNGKSATFTYTFGGIEPELNGSTVYAVIESASSKLTTDKVLVSVIDGAATPPTTSVPAAMEVFKDTPLDLYCQASSPDGSALSYIWYETTTGKLQDIAAVNRGTEERDTLRVDTSAIGTRYYVCGVRTANGGSAYTSVIPVTVLEKNAPKAPEITTKSLPDATVGEAYGVKLECTDPDAVFTVYQDPGKANDFEKTGLVLTQHGDLEGTPTKAGTFSFALCAAGEGGEGYMTYTLTVKEKHTDKPVAPDEAQKPDTSNTTEKNDTPSKADDSDKAADTGALTTGAQATEKDEGSKGMPWWGILLIALAAAGAGVGGTFLILKKKK